MILRRKLEPSEISGWLVFGQWWLLPGHGRPRSNCANLYVQPRSHVLLDLSLLSFWMFLGDLLGFGGQGRIATWCSGGSWFRKKCNESQLHQNQLVRWSQWQTARIYLDDWTTPSRRARRENAAQWCLADHPTSGCLVNRSMKLTSKLPLLTRCIAVCSESKKHD